MQNGQFGSKIFFSKNMPKMNLQEQLSCSVQKTLEKNSQYSRNAKCKMHNGQFGSKNFFSKNMPKMNLQEELSCSVQKTAGKNSQYLTNKTMLKIDHFVKSIAHAKWVVWVKNFFLQKYAENESATNKCLCVKNRWKKQPVFQK